jgi:hypothetical protein
MQNKLTNFAKWYTYMAVAIAIFIVTFVGIGLGMYYFAALIAGRFMNALLEMLLLSIPTIIFVFAYVVFFIRTRTNHPVVAVKYFSLAVFIAAIIFCIVGFIWALQTYQGKPINGIDKYYTFTLPYLTGNIVTLFVIGIIQALTMPAEEDWLTKHNKNN